MALLAKSKIYYRLYNWIQAWEVLRIKDEPVGYSLNRAHSDHSSRRPKAICGVVATCHYFKSISHNLTFQFPDHYPKQGGFCALHFPCFIIARTLEREKKKLVKISGDLELVILCIVKILVMRNVKQPRLILAPVSLGLSGFVLVGLEPKMTQVQILRPNSKFYHSYTDTWRKREICICVLYRRETILVLVCKTKYKSDIKWKWESWIILNI